MNRHNRIHTEVNTFSITVAHKRTHTHNQRICENQDDDLKEDLNRDIIHVYILQLQLQLTDCFPTISNITHTFRIMQMSITTKGSTDNDANKEHPQ